MDDRELTDLANVLLTAAGAGLALACGYLVMKPATRTIRKWVGASLVALPGLLLGVLLAHPDLGVRSAYGGLTEALLGSSTAVEETVAVPQPVAGEKTSSAIGGAAGTQEGPPTLAPSGDIFTGSPDSVEDPADTGSDDLPTPTPTETIPPPSPTETIPPPTPTETPPPPTPTETPPPPTPTETPPPPTPTETPPPTPTEPPPPPPPPEPSP